MTERDALLAAVCADPDSDLPRLAFADWLDDHGDHDRAEFIRVQIQLAREAAERQPPTQQLGGRVYGRTYAGRAPIHAPPANPELAERVDALMRRHMPKWLREYPRPGRYGGMERGFPTLLGVWRSSQLTPALFAAAPVTELHVDAVVDSVEALVGTPPGRIRGVSVTTLDDPTARRLLGWLTGSGFRRVVLSPARLQPDTLAELRSRLGGRLEEAIPRPNYRPPAPPD